jgi:uncharacterized protein (TIGR02118 family)
MIKIISAARRSSGLSLDELKRAMKEEHAPLVARFPALQSYCVSYSVAGASNPWDVVVELRFPSQEAFQAALASPAGKEALAHMRTIVDMASIQSGVFEELEDDSASNAR